jgi:hypothetical protein
MVSQRAVAQLAVVAGAPTVEPSVSGNTAGVILARGNLFERQTAGNRYGQRAEYWLPYTPDPELACSIAAPAEPSIIGGHRARVRPAGAHLPEIQCGGRRGAPVLHRGFRRRSNVVATAERGQQQRASNEG